MSDTLYHERQSRQLCALHALNNLFQEKTFSQKDLDTVCHELAPENHFWNPHKSVLGLGNYDINVILKSLEKKGFDAVWFDKRRDPSCLNLLKIKGFILNIPNPSYGKSHLITSLVNIPLSLIMSRKHWLSLVKSPHDNQYYNVDSKLEKPQLIGSDMNLIEFLNEKNGSNNCEIFVVVDRDTQENGSWSISNS